MRSAVQGRALVPLQPPAGYRQPAEQRRQSPARPGPARSGAERSGVLYGWAALRARSGQPEAGGRGGGHKRPAKRRHRREPPRGAGQARRCGDCLWGWESRPAAWRGHTPPRLKAWKFLMLFVKAWGSFVLYDLHFFERQKNNTWLFSCTCFEILFYQTRQSLNQPNSYLVIW